MIKTTPIINIYPVAYVRVESDVFKAIVDGCNCWADGDENLCITLDTLEADAKDINDESVREVLESIIKEVRGKASDLVIYS